MKISVPAGKKISNRTRSQELNNTESWKSLGNNQKNILIVVNYGNAVHLPDEELSFLTSMLAACKLSLG